jgi:hypothetical protein
VEGFFLARLPSYDLPDDSVGRSKAPLAATAASWMETFKMPLRQVSSTYRKSELVLLAWRSSEISANMASQYQNRQPNTATPALGAPGSYSGDADMEALEHRLGSVAGKLDERLALNELTGQEALRYMNALGIHVGYQKLSKPAPAPGSMEARVTEAYKDYGAH